MSYIGVTMARHQGAGGYISDSEDKGVTVRPSSTANFYVDSTDKLAGTSGDFVINKNQSLFNGFFNRIGVTEAVMDWGIPNVAQWWGNNFITVYVDVGAATATAYTVVIPDGFYTTLELLNKIVSLLATATGLVWSVGTSGSFVGLGCANDFFIEWEQSAADATVPAASKPNYIKEKALVRGLFSTSQLYVGPVPVSTPAPAMASVYYCLSPLVLGTKYVDITSPQLTYNQDLKDSTTALYARDVLYRWYLAWGEQTTTESFSGVFPFPIYQGYKPFNQRRALPYPKQIRWSSAQPIGQVAFQSYDDRGRLIDTSQFTPSANYQFQLSMLLSEN